MTNKRYAFVGRKCPYCDGIGGFGDGDYEEVCHKCQGTGMICGYEEVPVTDINKIPFLYISSMACQLRKVREKRKVGMDELAKLFGWSLVHLSDIETGRVQPTEAERQQIQEWIERG